MGLHWRTYLLVSSTASKHLDLDQMLEPQTNAVASIKCPSIYFKLTSFWSSIYTRPAFNRGPALIKKIRYLYTKNYLLWLSGFIDCKSLQNEWNAVSGQQSAPLLPPPPSPHPPAQPRPIKNPGCRPERHLTGKNCSTLVRPLLFKEFFIYLEKDLADLFLEEMRI